jgi:hypothetical protein
MTMTSLFQPPVNAGLEIHLTGGTNVPSSDFIPIIKTSGNSSV